MRAKAEPEARFLNAAELEMMSFTQYAIEQLPIEQLKSVGRRLRQAHVRAKDISARQQREIRGKADPRGASPTQDNSGTMAKAKVLHEALERVEDELRRREEMDTATPSRATLSRHALELKLSGQTKPRPGPGRSASEGMQNKERREPPKVGTTKREVGRVSQAGKVFQARKDAAKR